MGFGDKWIKWIHFCFSTMKLSVIINGSLKGLFETQKGLRQGNHFPFLFTLVVEGFAITMTTTDVHIWIKGLNANVRNQGTSPWGWFSYFLRSDRDQILYLWMIHLFFEPVFGLHINYTKSVLYPVNEVRYPTIDCWNFGMQDRVFYQVSWPSVGS